MKEERAQAIATSGSVAGDSGTDAPRNAGGTPRAVWNHRTYRRCAVRIRLSISLWCLALSFFGAQQVFVQQVAVAQSAPSVVVFGGDHAYPPFEWIEKGKPRGFNIELENKIAEIGGASAIHRLADWPDTLRALENGDVDIVPMFYSPERAEKFHFSLPFYQLSHVIYGRPGAKNVTSIVNLKDGVVVVESASFAHDEIVRMELPVSLLLADDTLDALKTVVSGRADYAVLASAAADDLIQRHKLALKRVSPPMWPRAYSFAVRKERESISRWLDQNFQVLIAEGYYGEIFARWENQLEPQEFGFVDGLKKAAYVVVPLAALMALGFLWSWSLRQQVAVRTSELTMELKRRQAAEKEIRYLADHDETIGFPNLHHYLELADKILEKRDGVGGAALECCVLKVIELPGVIRAFGFSAGDDLVREFAARLMTFDYHAYGYLGQGVFIVLAGKGAVPDNWRQITSPLELEDITLSPHVVAGIAHWPEHGENAARLLRAAEIAFATGAAKKLPSAEYHPSMEPDPQDLNIVSSFRHGAVEGLYAVYQPQVSVQTGRIEATESLVRWRHPVLGMVPPGRFIPLLENAGLITYVTQRMIEDALRMWTSVSKAGHTCRFSVNVAAHDLLVPDFPETIREAAERHGCSCSCLKLELTETSLAEATNRIGDVLNELRDLGVHIAVDDFGTGYSSLSYLSAFPLDEIKIDRSFVANMLTSPRDRSIVRSTISMAHELGLKVVAEGAEDRATIDVLKQDGCDFVQGYGISRPLLEDELLKFLRRHALIN